MVKKRYWGGVVYPESAPADWIEILKIKGLAFAISPLHDKDLNPTGEKKKPHYHIILVYAGPTSFNAVNELLKELNQPIPIALESVRGMYRYFIHKDNPEKYQYDEKDIQVFNGFNVDDVLNSFEVFHCLGTIQDIINDNNIIEYASLMNILRGMEDKTLWNVACSHTLFLDTYIRSKRHTKIS